MPISEFMSRYFARKGYQDGIHGLSLSLLMAFYHLVIFMRLWEKNNFKEQDDSLELFIKGKKDFKRQISFCLANEKLESEKNPLKKQLYRIVRKKNSS